MAGYDRYDPTEFSRIPGPGRDDWLGKKLPSAPVVAVIVSLVCFVSAFAAPVVLYFADGSRDPVGGGRVAATTVGAVFMLALAWISLLLAKRDSLSRGNAWLDRDLSKRGAMIGLLAAGLGFGVLGSWLLITGNWGGIVPLLIGSPAVFQGLRLAHRAVSHDESTAATWVPEANQSPRAMDRLRIAAPSAGNRAGVPVAAALGGIATLVMAARNKRRVALVGLAALVGFIALIVAVPRVSYLGGTMVSALVLAIIDAVIVVALMPPVWARRGSTSEYVVRTFRVKSFEWSWFDRSFMVTVALVMVANLFVKWVLARPDWFLSVAEFILAAGLVALVYEALRRFLWAPALGGLYTEVQCCSRCGRESDRIALRCPGCGAMFKFE